MKQPAAGAAQPAAAPERLPAYFLSLSVENVRCFGPKQTLDLSDRNGKPAPWTIILGLNGTGKTTLLQSLAGFEEIREQDDHDNEPIDLPRLVVPSYRGRPFFQRGAEERCFWYATFVASAALNNDPVRTASYQLMTRPHELGYLPPYNQEHEHVAAPRCFAYGAGRRIGPGALREAESDEPTATLFSDHAELRNPEEWLIQLDYAAKANARDKAAQQRFDLAKELLLSIMPEGEITDIRCVPGSGPNPKARAEFLTPYGWVPLRQLGYGYQTLITWVADLANRMAERYPDSPNPLAEPAVVLVDEIDLHLHPQWQRKLMGFLRERFPNTQFIATAHSPLVAQAAADANLVVLRREGDHVVIDNEVDNIRNWRVDQILTSDLFGLETARPPYIEAKLLERKALMTKPKLSAADERRLAKLEAEIGELPTGESTKEIREREKILQLLEELKRERKPAT